MSQIALQMLTIPANVYVQGSMEAKSMKIPASAVTDASVAPGAGLAATKLQHRYQPVYSQGIAANAATAEEVIHVAKAAGVVNYFGVALHVAPDTAPGSSGRTATFDLKKNGTTVLSGTVQLDNANTARTLEDGTISVGPFAAGDVFTVSVTAAGSSGTHAIGVFAIAQFDEAAS